MPGLPPVRGVRPPSVRSGARRAWPTGTPWRCSRWPEQRGHRGEVDLRRSGGGERAERLGEQRGPDEVADICTEFEAARWMVHRAAWLADQGRPRSTEAAMAKLYASEVPNRARSNATSSPERW
ncbi:acyl-CoA dehydrogenase family protein [Streptomyces mirabilis]|uniref:acyl-CoA dehydrogenase family protein n=1 Tax=Streptomyces mirabilis TaxID=68239 RepID=UPI00369A75ED